LIDKDYDKIKKIEESNPSIYKAFVMNEINLKTLLIFSNVVISSIYSNGEKASKVITNKLLDLMSRSRTIIMDVAIDQGGTTEQSVPMTFQNPVVRYKNTVIYCVPNIPSSAPVEASILLSNSIYPYLLCFLVLDSNSCDSSYSSDYNGYRKRFDELQKGLYVNYTAANTANGS
jgi:alanine dehydrogenase